MNSGYQLLQELSGCYAPSGDEGQLTKFLVDYVERHAPEWRAQPTILWGEEFQNNVLLVFGKPRTAVFAHIDSIGFTVRYENQLVPIGSPEISKGSPLRGEDSLGPIECTLSHDPEGHAFYQFGRPIDRGTNLVWNSLFRETADFVQGPYMDNRLGVYAQLKVAETLKDGVLVFSTWEEHGGGSVPFLIKYLYETYRIRQTLVSDITWVTDGIEPGGGVVISVRDRNIPRRAYLDKVLGLAQQSGVRFQLEVEGGGSSDGREIHQAPYPIDWLFVGAPEENVHSPDEKVHKSDIEAMIKLYRYLLLHL